MPHAPLEPETSNKTTTRNELVSFQRGVIVGRYLSAQKKKADVQRATGLPYSTIHTTIKEYMTFTTGTSALGPDN